MRAPGKRFVFVDRHSVLGVVKFCVLAALVVWVLGRGTQRLGYHWQWYRVPRYLFTMDEGRLAPGLLLEGLAVTLRISAASLVLAFVLGLTAAVLRLSGSLAGRILARTYLELIRNTPLLIQILFIYFVLSPVLDMSAFFSAVLALSLFEGAYTSEILRAGIVSVHRGQWEAAHSLGLSGFQTYRRVILPQALRTVLPPLAGQGISLVKDSALVSTIAIYDMTMQAQAIISETYLAFEIWFTVAAVYLVITLSLSVLVGRIEGWVRLPS